MAVIVRGGADKSVPGVLHVSVLYQCDGKTKALAAMPDTLSSTAETTMVGRMVPPHLPSGHQMFTQAFSFLSIQVKYFYSEVLSP